MKELIFEDTPHCSNGGFIDGPCKLPLELDWPHDSASSPLFHLLSIPLQWLNQNQMTQSLSGKWVSVFISYDKECYSHYGKMSSDDTNHTEAMVILHDMSGPERTVHPQQAAISKNVRLIPAIDGDSNVASYIESVPSWVQDSIDIEEYKWVMSIYGPDMDNSLGDNRGILSDGVGYVFLKTNIDPNLFGVVGKFFLQI